MTTVRRSHPGVVSDRDGIVGRLREGGHTVGRTRRAVIDAVLARDTAFTADELAAALPDVHVATVYRSLGLLEEIGALRHVHLSHGPAVYERTGTDDVRHLVCEVCDRHLAVPSSVFAEVADRLDAEFGFSLDSSHFAIVGRCRDCAPQP